MMHHCRDLVEESSSDPISASRESSLVGSYPISTSRDHHWLVAAILFLTNSLVPLSCNGLYGLQMTSFTIYHIHCWKAGIFNCIQNFPNDNTTKEVVGHQICTMDLAGSSICFNSLNPYILV